MFGQNERLETQFKMDIQGQLIPINCLVVKEIHVNLLLGIDFLKTYKTKLNFKENYITIKYSMKIKCFKIFFMKITKRITTNEVTLERFNRTQVYQSNTD